MATTTERLSDGMATHVLLEDTNDLLHQFDCENLPNVGKCFFSMRRMGYDNAAALADIVDNSIDGGATLVRVLVQTRNGEHVFTVIDNGRGMNYATLDEAMKLGSDTSRDETSDLGFYGMGLVTASISIGECITVITKEEGGPILCSIQDLQVMKKLNRFVKHVGEADEEQKAIFNELLPNAESGTVVRITKCDQVQDKNTSQFGDRLVKKFARTYRMFLSSPGRLTLFVNTKQVHADDPLMFDAEGQSLEYDHNLDVKYKDADGTDCTESVRIRIVRLPDYSQDMNKQLAINQENQGFALLRNNREIGFGKWYDLWTEKHNDLNRVRGEIFFPGKLDDLFGVDFTKQSPKFKQSLTEQLKKHVQPEISRLKSQTGKKRRREKDSQVSHTEAEKLIAQKSNILPKTRIEIERRERERREQELKPGKEWQETAATDGSRTRTPKKTHAVEREPKLPCRFETEGMTPAGPIFDAEWNNGVITILWNRDHVFYERFILENKDNPSMLIASDFLVFALAKAELGYSDEKTKGVLEDIRGTLSSIMRQLLT